MDKMSTYTLKARSVMRPLVLLPALVVGLSLAFTAAASAQTTVASVDNLSTNGSGNPGVTCPNQFYCGTANIPGYGPAFWSYNMPPDANPTPDGPDCYDYWGTSTFTPVKYPSSQLVLNENGVKFCFPGNSGNAPNFWKSTDGHLYPWGHPNRGGGNWSVCNASTANSTTAKSTGCGGNTVSSGVFQNWTGSGTDSLQSNGAVLTGTWVGTVTSSQ